MVPERFDELCQQARYAIGVWLNELVGRMGEQDFPGESLIQRDRFFSYPQCLFEAMKYYMFECEDDKWAAKYATILDRMQAPHLVHVTSICDYFVTSSNILKLLTDHSTKLSEGQLRIAQKHFCWIMGMYNRGLGELQAWLDCLKQAANWQEAQKSIRRLLYHQLSVALMLDPHAYDEHWAGLAISGDLGRWEMETSADWPRWRSYCEHYFSGLQ